METAFDLKFQLLSFAIYFLCFYKFFNPVMCNESNNVENQLKMAKEFGIRYNVSNLSE